ncbi:MFS transporter [Mucilaginibacter pocheonensis]|uniref:UMF1 family MFS transporter n=1 Tax=Mucilaginibacter pocheonensis TaxID=398050 RepID=A0ABU1TGK8_9SPHI|nr:MFS transporter [Mucilaginibacter pocheonensis]MDR6944389.1 UMF1 family MFS transporter [Mucilaginibacter pocheonensis]
MKEKNDKKTIWAWAMFDWANQSYNMVILSTIFPAYYVAITANKQNGNMVTFLGHKYINTVLSSYILGLSYLIIVAILPILTSIADYKGHKKLYMQLFTWMGSLACAGLFFFTMDTFVFGMICFGLASVGYCGGFVFYNSYLPQIATEDKQDAVSAKGFIYGFAGSIVVQVLCFVFVLSPKTFGITDDVAARLSFLIVGIWWIGFSLIPFYLLPKGVPNAGSHEYNVLTGGFKELVKVWRKVKEMPLLKRFLPAFFFYSVGVQTILLVAANFGAKELKMPEEDLITIILLIQIVAIIGAAITAKMSAKYGNTKVLAGIIAIWCVICGAVYFVANAHQFYAAAVVVGLVMGGVQSLSRSTYSKYIPQNIPDTASYFSFYDVTEKLSIVVGLFTFGFVEAITHEMRDSALVLDCFFAVGFILLISLMVVETRVRSAESVAA